MSDKEPKQKKEKKEVESAEKKVSELKLPVEDTSILKKYLLEFYDKDKKKESLKNLETIFKTLDSAGVEKFFNEYFQIIKYLKQNDKNKEFNIFSLLLADNSYVFADKYFQNIEVIYPCMIKINNFIDLSYTPSFSREPESALYGVKIPDKEGSGSMKKIPLDPEEVIKIINAEIKTENFSRAGKWIYSIMTFSNRKLQEVLENAANETIMNRSLRLIKQVNEEVSKNVEYKKALTSYLCESDSVILISMIQKSNEIIANSQQLEKTNGEAESKLSSVTEENTRLQERINSLQKELDEANKKINEIPSIKSEAQKFESNYKDLRTRYEAQIEANEDIEIAKIRAEENYRKTLEQKEDEIDSISAECNKLDSDVEKLTREKTNLESDLQNVRNQLSEKKRDMSASEQKIKYDITGDIISSIKEYLEHFSKSFALFKDSKSFDEITLDICIKDLNALIDSLASFNVSLVDKVGCIVEFDNSKHHCEESVKNGEKVKIVGYGWKVADTVISKAEVEKIGE